MPSRNGKTLESLHLGENVKNAAVALFSLQSKFRGIFLSFSVDLLYNGFWST
jgi:hypothetical protein